MAGHQPWSSAIPKIAIVFPTFYSHIKEKPKINKCSKCGALIVKYSGMVKHISDV